MSDERFSEAVCRELGNYVYRLIDPRNGETFYVGKGKGNRVFAHVSAALDLEKNEDVSNVKIGRIHEIRRSGLSVLHVIHRHGIPDGSVYEVEAAVMDAYSGLSNIVSGHSSNDRGPMHAHQIIDKFDLPTIDIDPVHKLVLINVNKFEASGKEALYQQVRSAWRVNPLRVKNADYVLAVRRGIVIGAFKADCWEPAIKENFPDEVPIRYAFSGCPASDEIWDLYCGERGKRVAHEKLKHGQNPIRYWKV